MDSPTPDGIFRVPFHTDTLPPSFPMTPLNAGCDAYTVAPDDIQTRSGAIRQMPFQSGDWIYQPRYINCASMVYDLKEHKLWNRGLTHLIQIKPEHKIYSSFSAIKLPEEFRWLHVLCIGGMDVNVLDKCFLIADIIKEGVNFRERREILEKMGPTQHGVAIACIQGIVRLVPNFTEKCAENAWIIMHEMNTRRHAVPTFDGMIAKKLNSKYVMQLEDYKKEFITWLDHKFDHINFKYAD